MVRLQSEQLVQAKIIMLALDQNNRGIPMEANRAIIRAAVGNIMNAFINQQIGDHKKFGLQPRARLMSKGFFQRWSILPTVSNLRSVGIYEHKTPMKVLINWLVDAADEIEILTILRENCSIMWVTHEEDQELDRLGLKSQMPKIGDRYQLAGIEENPGGPVIFKGKDRGLSVNHHREF
jgi:hypothetical protein